MSDPIDPAEQQRRDKEYSEYLANRRKRGWPDMGFTDQFGNRWNRPSDILTNPALSNPNPPSQRRRKRI
jgi:hypothetical protein